MRVWLSRRASSHWPDFRLRRKESTSLFFSRRPLMVAGRLVMTWGLANWLLGSVSRRCGVFETRKMTGSLGPSSLKRRISAGPVGEPGGAEISREPLLVVKLNWRLVLLDQIFGGQGSNLPVRERVLVSPRAMAVG